MFYCIPQPFHPIRISEKTSTLDGLFLFYLYRGESAIFPLFLRNPSTPDMPSRPVSTLSWDTATVCRSAWVSSRVRPPYTAFATPSCLTASKSSVPVMASRPAASFRPTLSLPRRCTTKNAPVTLSTW